MGDAVNDRNQIVVGRVLNIPNRLDSSDSSDLSDSSDTDSSDLSSSSESDCSTNYQPKTISANGKHLCDTKMIPCSQTWTIDNFDQFISNPLNFCGQYPKIYSHKFSTPNYQGLEFRLDIRPRGESFEDRDYVALFLSSEGHGKRMINAEMSVIDINGQKQHTKCCLREDSASSADYGWYRFVSHKELKDQRNSLMPNGKLTVHVDVNILINQAVKDPPLRQLLKIEEQSLSDHLEDIFKTGLNTDVKLVVGRRVIDAHKFILQQRSPVFSAMFQNDMKEKNNGRVQIKEVPFSAFKLLVRYMYCNKIDEHQLRTHCADLYMAADMYQMDSLKKICESALCAEAQVKPQLTRQMVTISELYDSSKLREKTLNSARKRALEIVKTMKSESLLELNEFLNNANTAAESNQNVGRDLPSTSANNSSSLSAPTSKPKRSRRHV